MGQLAEIEQRVAEREAAVDLLVNNAGFGISGDFAGHLVEDVEGEILVNVLALARLCHAALGRMVDEGRGAILNVSSTASFQPMPGSAGYASTKAYVTSLSQALHEEVLGAGVAVTALCPGLTRTEFQQRGGFVIEVPGLLWQRADDVARAGLDGVAANHAVVIPGVHNAATAHVVRLLPLGVARRVAAVVGRRLG
jgi:hypothetical protein